MGLFDLFSGKKKQETAMDGLIKALYGNSPPSKRANLSEAIDLSSELLMGEVSEREIATIVELVLRKLWVLVWLLGRG
jgi:hypothetical protein